MVGLLFPIVYEPLRLPEGHFALDPEGEEAKKTESANKDIEEQAPAPKQVSEHAPKQVAPLKKAEMGEASESEVSMEAWIKSGGWEDPLFAYYIIHVAATDIFMHNCLIT